VIASADLVLALDSGSQSSRALLFDRDGQVLGQASRAHQPMKHPEEGAVEQDVVDIRDCLFGAIRDCLAGWGGDPSRVSAASLTTQRSTMVPCDRQGRPLADAVSWLDRRTASVASEPSWLLRAGLKAMGSEALLPRLLARSVGRLWRERRPELLAQVGWIAPLEAWLVHELCGRVAMAPGGIAGVVPSSLKRRGWSSSPVYCRMLGFEPQWLPEIVEAGRRIGGFSAGAAEATGLPEGLPLVACGGDKQAETLGAGVRAKSSGVASISLGTAASVMVPWPAPLQSGQVRWVTVCSCEPGSWHLEYMVFRGMWTAAWFARTLGRDLAGPAAERGLPVEALLCEEAAEAPPGSGGLVTWPRWSPTLQDPDETGVVFGLRETHDRGHMFRSLLEGVAFDLKRGVGILERATGTRVTEARVGGGGSRSSVVVQILADVLDLPIRRPSSEELAARGAAIVAAAGGGLHPTLDAAVAAMVPEAPTVQPDPDRAAVYRRLFDEVVSIGAQQTKKLSQALARFRRSRLPGSPET